jgi:hypothetical protein
MGKQAAQGAAEERARRVDPRDLSSRRHPRRQHDEVTVITARFEGDGLPR